MEKRTFNIEGAFELENGQFLESPEICYHISGNTTPGKKIIWICHALTANSDPSEWWPGLVGDGKTIDPAKHTIICANMPGSCYGSTGPSSLAPDGKPYLMRFPEITVRDVVKMHNSLREHLGIDSIYLMTGASIGGFQALEWSIIYPDIVENLLLIACNAAVTPWGCAFNESQRMALKADPTFTAQKDINGGKEGLKAARSIALLSYRSQDGYNQTQSEVDSDFLFAARASSYQQYQGQKLAERFDAYSYYTLTKCIDSHNCGRDRGGTASALGTIKASTVVAGIESDLLFPAAEQEYLAKHIPGARFRLIRSAYGHDGFLLEYEQTQTIIHQHFKL